MEKRNAITINIRKKNVQMCSRVVGDHFDQFRWDSRIDGSIQRSMYKRVNSEPEIRVEDRIAEKHYVILPRQCAIVVASTVPIVPIVPLCGDFEAPHAEVIPTTIEIDVIRNGSNASESIDRGWWDHIFIEPYAKIYANDVYLWFSLFRTGMYGTPNLIRIGVDRPTFMAGGFASPQEKQLESLTFPAVHDCVTVVGFIPFTAGTQIVQYTHVGGAAVVVPECDTWGSTCCRNDSGYCCGGK